MHTLGIMPWTWPTTKPKGLGASLNMAQRHGPWDWKKAWSWAQHDDSDADSTPNTYPMHGDRLMGTGAQVGIAIGCTAGVVCAAHTVAAARNDRHAAPSRPRRAIVDSSRWTGWTDSGRFGLGGDGRDEVKSRRVYTANCWEKHATLR